MDPFLDQLKGLCAAHPTRSKWVFVPSHAIGRTIGERIALNGTNWLNLRFVTPLDIALRMGAPFLVERGIDPSEEGLGPALMMRLLLDLPEKDGYFRPLAGWAEFVLRPAATWRRYCAGVTGDGTVGLFRLEVSITDGTGKLKTAGGLSGLMKESVQRAHSYLSARKNELGIARELDDSDLHVEVIDLLGNRVEAEVGVAFFVAANSALKRAPVTAGLLVLGDMSVQGQLKPLAHWRSR